MMAVNKNRAKVGKHAKKMKHLLQKKMKDLEQVLAYFTQFDKDLEKEREVSRQLQKINDREEQWLRESSNNDDFDLIK